MLPGAGGRVAGRAGGSRAISKQMDFSITQEVLRAYGDAVKDQIRRVLKAIAAAREDGLEISVTGMDEFDIADFSTELSEAQQLLALGVDSPTLKKEIFKRLALKYLSDARQEVKDRIVEEIEEDSSQESGVSSQNSEVRMQNSESPRGEELRSDDSRGHARVARSGRSGPSLEKRINELVAENRETQKSAVGARGVAKAGRGEDRSGIQGGTEDVRAIEDAGRLT